MGEATGNQVLGAGMIIDTPVMLKLQEMRQMAQLILARERFHPCYRRPDFQNCWKLCEA